MSENNARFGGLSSRRSFGDFLRALAVKLAPAAADRRLPPPPPVELDEFLDALPDGVFAHAWKDRPFDWRHHGLLDGGGEGLLVMLRLRGAIAGRESRVSLMPLSIKMALELTTW